MPGDYVVDAYAEVGKEPEEDDGRKQVTELARAEPLEDEEQNQNGARHSNDSSCSSRVCL